MKHDPYLKYLVLVLVVGVLVALFDPTPLNVEGSANTAHVSTTSKT